MNRLSKRIALLTVVGVFSAMPAFAAPPNSSSTQPGQDDANKSTSAVDCSLPQNKLLDACKNYHPFKGSNGPNGNGPGNNTTTNNMFGNGYNGPRQGTFNFNQQDRNFFHQHFRGFNFGNFGFFGAPTFSITIGSNIPFRYHSHLRRVPANIYRYYPWFRGYFFFVDARGDFVIVNPRNFRIVAVL